MIRKLNFKAGPARQPRANVFLRAGRILRRKRVAHARALLCENMKALQRQIARYEALAAVYDVPVASMGPLPAVPGLPGVEWVEFRQAIGELREPVRPAGAVSA